MSLPFDILVLVYQALYGDFKTKQRLANTCKDLREYREHRFEHHIGEEMAYQCGICEKTVDDTNCKGFCEMILSDIGECEDCHHCGCCENCGEVTFGYEGQCIYYCGMEFGEEECHGCHDCTSDDNAE